MTNVYPMLILIDCLDGLGRTDGGVVISPKFEITLDILNPLLRLFDYEFGAVNREEFVSDIEFESAKQDVIDRYHATISTLFEDGRTVRFCKALLEGTLK